MLNLLILTLDPPSGIGGLEGRATAYKKELSALGHSVTLVSVFRLNRKNKSYAEDYALSSGFVSFPYTFLQIISIIRSRKIERIFILSGSDSLIGVATLLLGKFFSLKTASLFHGRDVLRARRSMVRTWLQTISINLAGCIATNSKFTSNLFKDRLQKNKKVVLLYPGVDPEISFHRDPDVCRDDQTILFVGRLVRRKGLEYLIRAIALLKPEFPLVRLLIVGSGPELGRMQEIVKSLGLEGNVMFAGELRDDDLSKRYETSTIFAMPSITLPDDVEGFGTVFLEAGLRGLPSVATFSGGIPEAVIDGRTGMLVRQRDAAELSRTLRLLLLDKKKRLELGEEARNRALNQFSWHSSAKSLVSCFE